ncbi:MAG TPA: S41 family peptidase [Gemmatimonadales bacterium]|nr:S41 family peptidase [Gemmatimonadales bacterium]
MRPSNRRWLISLLVLTPLGTAAVLVHAHRSPAGPWLVEQVMERIATQSIDTATTSNIYEKTARGLIDQMDDAYAELYSPEQLQAFQRETIGNHYAGLGMSVELEKDSILVGRVFQNTPAATAGLQSGDRIVKVDGVPVTGLGLDSTTSKIRGPAGTPVTVTVRRYGPDEIDLHAIRAEVHVPAVPFALMLDGKIGYIPLQRFNETSDSEVADAITRLKREGAKSYILDLRGNGGGSLDQAIKIGGLFLPSGSQVVTVKYRAQPDEVGTASGTPMLAREPMVVLLDGYTASASEIVSGSLQDHDRALVVGERSFGKGLVQSLFPLDQGWAMKFTTGKWYTPSGRSIQRARAKDGSLREVPADTTRYRTDDGRPLTGGGGITPDVVVAPDTLTTVEKSFASSLSKKGAAVAVALNQLSRELAAGAKGDFKVTPAWHDSLYSRITRAGVEIGRATFDSAGRVADRLIEQRVAQIVGADSLAFRRDIRYDAQLARAEELLRGAKTQVALLDEVKK